MIEFSCPKCEKKFKVADHVAGKRAKCHQCGCIVRIPGNPVDLANDMAEQKVQLHSGLAPDPASRTPDEGVDSAARARPVFCPKCGARNLENNYKCTECTFVLHGSPLPQHVVTNDGTMGGLIPYKNARALWAYYLGVFSLIPCVGIPLGVAALVLGIQGLKFAELRPEAKGKVHAWVGIILGALSAIGYTLLIIGTIVAARS